MLYALQRCFVYVDAPARSLKSCHFTRASGGASRLRASAAREVPHVIL